MKKIKSDSCGKFFYRPHSSLIYNQGAIANAFALQSQLRFDATQGDFAQYSEKRGLWESVDKHALKGSVAGFIKAEAAKEKEEEAVQKITSGLLSAITDMLKTVCPDSPITQPKAGLFAVKNGVLDLAGSVPKLMPFSPNYDFTSSSSVDYNPKAKCPRFLKELLKVALNEADISLVQRYFGSVLMGENRAQRILVLRGTAGGGKSTMVTLLEEVLGKEHVGYLRTTHLSGRFETAGLLGKRLLTAKDVPGDTLHVKGAQLLKSLVGGDLVEVEKKFMNDRVQLSGKFHVVITVNNRLSLRLDGDEEAWRRRLLLVEFKKPKVVKPIPNFAQLLLTEEGSGILNWLIEGSLQNKLDLKKRGDMELNPDQVEAVDDMIDEAQAVQSFLKRVVRKANGGQVTVQELFQGFLSFCQEKGWTPKTETQFYTELPQHMQEIHQVTKRNDIPFKVNGHASLVRGFKGVALTAD